MAFAKEVVFQAFGKSLSAVAADFGVSWDTVYSIVQGYLTKNYSRIQFNGVTSIAIDETSVGKGHKYITVVIDLDSGDPIFVGEGKSQEALEPFWELLGKRKNQIEVVAMDMGAAFQKAVKENLPKAKVVVDHFHVIKLMNDKIDRLRRMVMASGTQELRSAIAGNKYLLLKNESNLNVFKGEDVRLKKLLELNTPLTIAYVLKESLRQIWDHITYAGGKASLEGWIAAARASGINVLVSMANTMEKHSEGILNYFIYRVTSGQLEGLNNKIKVLIRRAYGYRNLEHFKRLVYAIKEFNPIKMFSSA